jgi:uncharacterized ferritin-like protein (DUF455 family)
MNDFGERIHAALTEAAPETKCALAACLAEEWDAEIDASLPEVSVATIAEPGHPLRPELVSPQSVPKRSLSTLEGRAALIHSLAHIEFNAISLALDAAYRFRGLPRDFYGDWLKVAGEEAYHFQLLCDHLRTMGFDYGDFAAHSGLWDMAMRTAHDPLVRMALVPRVLEARGLDVTPGLRAKLIAAGDAPAARILEIIERDEIGHVAIGNRWYRYLCAQRGVEPIATFRALMAEYGAPRTVGPLHREARLAAGFSATELELLEGRPGRG